MLRLVARLDAVCARGLTHDVEERLVSLVARLVPHPDVTQYDIDGRLVVSVALREHRAMADGWVESAVEIVVVSNAAFFASTQPQPPQDVSKDLPDIQVQPLVNTVLI